MGTELNRLEREVMEMLLAGDDPTLRTLAEQFRSVVITGRDLSGAGFFTKFVISSGTPRLPGSRSFSFGDVHAQIAGLAHGAGFVLHVRNGAIDCLEGYSYDEPWPTNADVFQLKYGPGESRDWAALRRERE